MGILFSISHLLGYTFQLGDFETTAVHLRYPFVCNLFYNKDVALGGQGAPLVPNGEKFLFSHKDICINLSGIANIGLRGLQGYDVIHVIFSNMLNFHDSKLEYDPEGDLARTGKVIDDVLQQLEELDYYKQLPPKSMDPYLKFLKNSVLPLLDTKKYQIPDLLRTFAEHVANRLADACKDGRNTLNAELFPSKMA
ncbi:anmK [Mytilus edulis]|uniref:AnmK n=1 Tax=Mytilus edulis TaxID=6550 RepID=A0A8S3UNC6_MYTED|nr:anmK [Mytilus edulis]